MDPAVGAGPPDAEAFRALARSSPWCWRTLRLVQRPTGDRDRGTAPLRAWVVRQGGLRVESLDGVLGQATWTDRTDGGGRPSGWLRGPSGGWRPAPHDPHPHDPDPWAHEAEPLLRADGLVARRPGGQEDADDAILYRDHRWVAMLDPVELTDGEEPPGCDDEAPDVDGDVPPGPDDLVPVRVLGAVHEVDHHGRPAWEAVVVSTPAYDPRCSCCPLLVGEHADARERQGLAGADTAQPGWGPSRWPDAHRVRLDVGTGVVVALEPLGGDEPCGGCEVEVEAVDEPLDRALFEPPRRR